MKALVDASALLLLVKHLDGKKLADLASEIATLDLATYEAGNGIWKHATLLKLLSEAEARATHAALTKLLSRMDIVRGDSLDHAKTMELAVRKRITYYDACYLTAAGSLGLPLATEDRKLQAATVGQDVIAWKDLTREEQQNP